MRAFGLLGLVAVTLAVVLSNCASSTKNGGEARTPASDSSCRPTGTVKVGGTQVPICVIGGDDQSFSQPKPTSPPTKVDREFDVIVVGAGLAGLSAATYLSEDKSSYLKEWGAEQRSVLLLEKEQHLGGLAAGGSTSEGGAYDRGAAYWTNLYEEERRILDHIGMKELVQFKIPEPIDSYYWDHGGNVGLRIYSGIWEANTMGIDCPGGEGKCSAFDDWKSGDASWRARMQNSDVLPMSFSVFWRELRRASKDGLIPNQPFETQAPEHLALDKIDAKKWILGMVSGQAVPNRGALRDHIAKAGKRDAIGSVILSRFDEEKKFRKMPAGAAGDVQMMQDVVDMMDLYCRSALGSKAENISAVAFANFYISEIIPRYTTEIGTGWAARQMELKLRARSEKVRIEEGASVVKGGISQNADGVTVVYTQTKSNGQAQSFVAHGKYAVFAAQLHFAPELIEKFPAKRASLFKGVPYSHYSVHNLTVEGHPYRESYDTWALWPGKSDLLFTDVINGFWVNKKMYPPNSTGEGKEQEVRGNHGIRTWTADPKDSKNGELTIYHPLSIQSSQAYDDKYATARAAEATQALVEHFNPTAIDPTRPVGGFLNRNDVKKPDPDRLKIKVLQVKTSRWPFSVHAPRSLQPARQWERQRGHFAAAARRPHLLRQQQYRHAGV